MIEAKQIHSGQYKKYGDYIQEWEVKTDQTEEEAVEWCLTNLVRRRVPPKAEWQANIVRGGAKDGDMGYYFAGYYTITPIEGGFKFTTAEPYCD